MNKPTHTNPTWLRTVAISRCAVKTGNAVITKFDGARKDEGLLEGGDDDGIALQSADHSGSFTTGGAAKSRNRGHKAKNAELARKQERKRAERAAE